MGPGCVKTPTLNLRVEFPSRFRRCGKPIALATSVRRRQLRKQFCASLAQASFHTAWTQFRHWWQRLQAVTRTGHFYSFRFGSQPSRGKALRLVRSERRSKQVVDSLRYVCVSGGVEQPAYIKGSDPQWSLTTPRSSCRIRIVRGHLEPPGTAGRWRLALVGCGRHDEGSSAATFQLSPCYRKHNLPDQLRVRPSSDRSGIA